MRGASAAACVFILLAAMGAACADTPPVPLKPGDAAAPPPVPKSIWAIADNGDATHLQSGLICEQQSSQFLRTSVFAFKPSGLDVSCNYLDHFKSLITLYLTKRGSQSLADDFTEAKRELVYVDPKAVALSDTEQKSFASDLSWQSLIYSKQAGQLHSGIWVADLNGWTLEYRATYAPADEAAVLAEMAALTTGAEKSAGAQLSVCAKSSKPMRSGAQITDEGVVRPAVGMLSVFGAASTMLGRDDKRPLIWCEEGSVETAGVPVFLWHGVFPDGADGNADMVTPGIIEAPPELVSKDVSEVFKSGDGYSTPVRWLLQMKRSDRVWIFALYDGRPSFDALAAMMAAIVQKTARSIGGYGVNGKTIQIDMPPKD